MKHVRIGVYQFKPGVSTEEAAQITRKFTLPVYQQQPGFVAYEAIHVEGDRWVSITTWESQQQAEAAAERIAAFINQTPEVVGLIRSREHMWIGEVVFSSREP